MDPGRRWITKCLYVGISVGLTACTVLLAPPGNMVDAQTLKEVTYQSDTSEFPNPERGFMKQSNVFLDQPYTAKLGKVNPNDTLNWVYVHLDGYRDPRDGPGVTVSNYQFVPLQPVGNPDGKGLEHLKRVFDEARSKGLKIVLRFLYVGYSGIGSTSDFANAQPDAPLSIAQQHLDQLAPLVAQNKDVIALVQAGIVGYWGEWHSSKYNHPIANRKAIVDKILAIVPPDRMINIRYPKYLQAMYQGPLPDAQAYSGSTLSRLGLHDDAFVKDSVDDGTFTSNAAGSTISAYCSGSANTTQCWKDYFSQVSRYTPAGGEAGTHSGTPSAEADCAYSKALLSHLHFTYLHNGYSQVTLGNWINQGCMPEIRKRLGYRFVLSRATLPAKVTRGTSMTLSLTLTNEGYANMYNPRPVYVIFENMSTNAKTPVQVPSADPRRWLTQSMIATNTVALNVSVPSTIAAGMYRIHLWLPDAAGSLQNNTAYSVRIANANVWQASTGYNLLTDNIEVMTSGTVNTPTPTPPMGIEGDANRDGHVTGADYSIWLNHYGQTVTGGATLGDFNADGFVNGADYFIWLRNYGR
jgi:hypothetical protein